jgi:hypothetical protein
VVPVDPASGFNWIREQVLASQNVILLLGYWEEMTQGICERVGGHYVTVAGVCTNPMDSALCISDPYFDNNEAVSHPPAIHNDAQYVSGPHGTRHHDRYDVVPNTCMPVGSPPFSVELVITGRSGQLLWSEYLRSDRCPHQYQGPLHTIIEFAIVICPTVLIPMSGIPMINDNYYI